MKPLATTAQSRSAPVTESATLGGGRFWLTISNAWRYPVLWAWKAAGRVLRLRHGGWWPVATLLATAVAILLAVPLLLQVIVSFLHGIGLKGVDPAPKVSDWFSLGNVALVFFALGFLRWITRARVRVVVDSFVDYTTDTSTAVSGLSTLLVTELARLRGLYEQVTELAVPTAVGVERQGGFSRGKEAASFITVAADDVTGVLEGAIAADAKVEVGPGKISLAPLLAFLNRATRGPRVVGAVHLTEAGGGPTLTAQLVGGRVRGTWRVDHEEEPESAEERKAFLDTMVRELACRMYTQLTLGGSIRWQAVKAFNEYLQLYGDSQRTPRDRARFLKQAQGKLMSAVAEDERFDLAYYNLGVIYTQLAQAELDAERQSQDATSRTNLKRDRLIRARQEAARVAFRRAAERNAGRWEAYYALAVTEFSQVDDVDIDEDLAGDGRRRGQLWEVVSLCDQALRVAPHRGAHRAAIHDLRGMARSRLAGDEMKKAMRDHRRAVRGSWWAYCSAERSALAGAPAELDFSERARGNATAALHNLALAHERRALLKPGPAEDAKALRRLSRSERRDLLAAERVFWWAIRLAGKGSDLAAAVHFERGGALERRRKFREAAKEFAAAAQIHPTNCEYPARRARALALGSRGLKNLGRDAAAAEIARDARREAARALRLLARPYGAAVSPYSAEAVKARVSATLVALEKAHETLADAWPAGPEEDEDGFYAERLARVRHIARLRGVLVEACREPDERAAAAADRLARERAQLTAADRDWELAQIDLASGRLYAAARRWPRAKVVLGRLIATAREAEAQRTERTFVEFEAYADYARALRECGDYMAALSNAAECVRRDPLNVEGRREAGRAHFALGQYDDALAAWKQALWLSPSDPYLHYEYAMCHRRLAVREKGDDAQREMASAVRHFAYAQELFDGEDLDGEAWTRVWLGRVASEHGDDEAAVRHFESAEHGKAAAAAALLLGEAYLRREHRTDAEHAFERSREALDAGHVARLRGRTTIDAGWGDELPAAAVLARLERGLAEACCLVAGPSQDPKLLAQACDRLAAARDHLARITHPAEQEARERALALCLDTEARVLHDLHRLNEALERTRERLRYEASPDALRFEQQLMAELANGAPTGSAAAP